MPLLWHLFFLGEFMVNNVNKKNLRLGIIFMIFSTLGFSFMQIFVKLTAGKFPLMQQVFFRNFVMAIMCAGYILYNKGSFFGEGKNRKLLLSRSLFGYLGVIANFYAINNMLVADAGILQRTSPIFVVLIACVVLKEKFTLEKFLTLIFAFIGAIFVVRPQFDSRLFPSLIAMLSALSASIAYLCVSRLGKNEKTETIMFVFSFFSTVCSLPFIVNNFVIPNFIDGLFLILIGVSSAFGQLGLTLSYQYANASDVSLFNYFGIVFVVILGRVILKESISVYSLIGILIIFSVSLVSYILKNKKIKN